MSNAPHSLDSTVVVDIGNSAAKFCRYRTTSTGHLQLLTQLRQEIQQLVDADSLHHVVASLFGPDERPARINWLVAAVQSQAELELRRFVENSRQLDSYRRLSNFDVPISIRVEFPDQVGIDRLLAACAAGRLKESHRSAVVVDAGSAITIDLVTADGRFSGGTILPGARMQVRSLHQDTDRLPDMDISAMTRQVPGQPVVGRSTEEAIRSGIFVGLLGAVSEIVRRTQQETNTPIELFVTGGDAGLLEDLAQVSGWPTHFVPDLVARGMCFTIQSPSNA